jgi:hypothetical protein
VKLCAKLAGAALSGPRYCPSRQSALTETAGVGKRTSSPREEDAKK